VTGVLVTGAGGGVGQGIIKALQGSRHPVVAADADPLAVGLHAAAVARLVPRADAPDFVDAVLAVCREEDCRIVFPGLDTELAVLARARPRFEALGLHLVVSHPDVVRIADDKLATAEFLTAHGWPAPRTAVFDDDVDVADWLPCVLKPRRGGSRSIGTYVVPDATSWALARARVDVSNAVIQEYVAGDEYTCGTVTLDSDTAGPIVMRRTLRAGDTYRAFVVRDRRIEDHVRAVVAALAPYGACNVQLRLRDDEPIVFEINARCSGTTAARARAGFNEPLMIVDHLLDGTALDHDIRELAIVRYWQELVVDPSRAADLETSGRSAGPPRPL